MGVTPEQIRKRKPRKKLLQYANNSAEYYGNLTNTIAPPVLKNDIWEQVRNGNESQATIAAIKEKATRCVPAYNKGGLQLVPKENLIFSGRK